LDLDRTEIPGAMLRMYQDSAGYRVEYACKELQKKEDKKRRKREKKEANDFLWDEDRRCLVNFVKYNIVEGRKIMNEVPAGFLPLYMNVASH
jgi:neutral trehalase